MKTFAIGDIHGNYKALMQCLQRANVDYENDTVIQLGDVVDGHCDSFEVVEELLKIKNLITIKGNHDDWFFNWLNTGIHHYHWGQGALATGKSYLRQIDKEHMVHQNSIGYMIPLIPEDVPASHWKFFAYQRPYYIDNKHRIFVHAGFDRTQRVKDIKSYNPEQFWWDRSLIFKAMCVQDGQKLNTADKFERIFIGHTYTMHWKIPTPIMKGGVINLDTGAGAFYKLTIMDVDSKEYWQSDNASELYPEYKGRT